MFERFTTAAREVVVAARTEAESMNHRFIGTEHLLLAMLDERSGIAYRVLHGAGLDRAAVRDRVRQATAPPPGALTAEDAAALRTIGIDLDAVLARLEESFGPEAARPPAVTGRGDGRGLLFRRRRGGPPGGRLGGFAGPPFSGRAKKVIGLALREAIHLKHNYIGTEHLLLGLIREGDGPAAKIITDAGVDLPDLRSRTLALLDEAA